MRKGIEETDDVVKAKLYDGELSIYFKSHKIFRFSLKETHLIWKAWKVRTEQ